MLRPRKPWLRWSQRNGRPPGGASHHPIGAKGVLLALAGIGLAAAQGWARWFAIVVVSLNVLAQLGFAGNSQYPLWALTVLTLSIFVLYALTVRWSESRADLIQR